MGNLVGYKLGDFLCNLNKKSATAITIFGAAGSIFFGEKALNLTSHYSYPTRREVFECIAEKNRVDYQLSTDTITRSEILSLDQASLERSLKNWQGLKKKGEVLESRIDSLSNTKIYKKEREDFVKNTFLNSLGFLPFAILSIMGIASITYEHFYPSSTNSSLN